MLQYPLAPFLDLATWVFFFFLVFSVVFGGKSRVEFYKKFMILKVDENERSGVSEGKRKRKVGGIYEENLCVYI